MTRDRAQSAFAAGAAGVLAYNILVVLWGAYVRVSFSGDGCGANWPLCNGQAVPRSMTVATAIEFTHRMMTSLDSLLIIAMCVFAFLLFPKAHAARRYAVPSVVFLLLEALLGAGLVKFRLVAHDQSAGRAWYLSAHLVNTLLLLAAVLTTSWAASAARPAIHWLRICSRRLAALAIVMFVSVTGALAALGDTLFPASSLASSMHQDFISTSSIYLRLRLMHPLFAVAGAVYIIWTTARMLTGQTLGPDRKATERVLIMTIVQIAAGVANIGFLAPVWMQLLHLLIADALWIVTLLWAFESLPVETRSLGMQPDLPTAVASHF